MMMMMCDEVDDDDTADISYLLSKNQFMSMCHCQPKTLRNGWAYSEQSMYIF